MIILVFILLIILDALSDGLRNKPVKHLFAALHIGGWLMFPVYLYQHYEWHWVLWPDFLIMIAGYGCLRYFLFDATWNISAGKRLDYVGSTSLYDRILSKMHPTLVLYTKLLAGMAAISILLTNT